MIAILICPYCLKIREKGKKWKDMTKKEREKAPFIMCFGNKDDLDKHIAEKHKKESKEKPILGYAGN